MTGAFHIQGKTIVSSSWPKPNDQVRSACTQTGQCGTPGIRRHDADRVPTVSSCCDPTPYRRFFNHKEAQRNVRSYRRKGLDPMAASMVSYLLSEDLEGAGLLEVGGGIGAAQIELLKGGLGGAVNVELSSAYEEAAKELAEAEGLADRLTRHLGDFVEQQDKYPTTDVVLMNRVVCCYPWMERIMAAAVAKTGRFLALAIPRERWWAKAGIGLGNRYLAIRGCGFRAFVHPEKAVEEMATRSGLVVRHRAQTLFWQAIVFERTA